MKVKAQWHGQVLEPAPPGLGFGYSGRSIAEDVEGFLGLQDPAEVAETR